MKKLILSMLLVGCGVQEQATKNLTQTEETKTVTESPKAVNPPMARTVSGEKPACSPENENQLIYSVDDQGFFTCSKNDWVAIDIKGKDGVNGKDGEIVEVTNQPVVKEYVLNVMKSWSATDLSMNIFTDIETFVNPKDIQIILYDNKYINVSISGVGINHVFTMKPDSMGTYSRIMNLPQSTYKVSYELIFDDQNNLQTFKIKGYKNDSLIKVSVIKDSMTEDK